MHLPFLENNFRTANFAKLALTRCSGDFSHQFTNGEKFGHICKGGAGRVREFITYLMWSRLWQDTHSRFELRSYVLNGRTW